MIVSTCAGVKEPEGRSGGVEVMCERYVKVSSIEESSRGYMERDDVDCRKYNQHHSYILEDSKANNFVSQGSIQLEHLVLHRRDILDVFERDGFRLRSWLVCPHGRG